MKDARSNTFLMHLETVINEKNPTLILCVIPSPRGDIYSLIKRKLCIDRAGINILFNQPLKYYSFMYHLNIFIFI